MKKHFVSTAFVMTAAFGSAAAHAADGEITFNGAITATTCEITTPDGPGATDFTVTLPTLATTAFSGADDRAGATGFWVEVGTTTQPCTATGVTLAWDAADADIDQSTGRLNNGTGTATGVQLNMKTSTLQDINLFTNTPQQVVAPDASGVARLNYLAEYVQESANPITAGTVISTLTYSVSYL